MAGRSPKPSVFVLMPFKSEFDDVYQLGIVAACKEAGAYCERVDEQIYQGSILERIYVQIAKADIIIADMTGQNPNVFYETGYAHALGKAYILLTQRAEDIPFDLKHYPHIVYGSSIVKLKEELKQNVRWHIDNPEKKTPGTVEDIEFLMYGTSIARNAVVHCNAKIKTQMMPLAQLWDFTVDLHNETDRIIDHNAFDFGLVFERSQLEPTSLTKHVYLSDQEVMLMSNMLFLRLLPHNWTSQVFQTVWPVGPSDNQPIVLNCKLKLFTEIASTETPFVILLKGS